MKKPLTILMAAAECRGVAKVGGLGDVVYDLSRRLGREGHRVLVALPLYSSLPLASSPDLQLAAEGQAAFEGRLVPFRVWKALADGLEVHLIDAEFFRDSLGTVYIDSGKRGKGPFEDDARRFAFFSAAVWQLVKEGLFREAQVVHCHDWHTAWIPLLARLDGLASKYPTVFTIHNLDYQGTRPWDEAYAEGASWRQWFPDRWEALEASPWKAQASDPGAPHCFNPMRCGIRLADGVNTVSPSYALEICQADDPAANFLGGRGLEGDLARRRDEGRLWGILNGLDYEAFDPGLLDPPFGPDDPDLLARRRVHRERLWAELPTLLATLTAKHGPRFANASRARAHVATFLEAGKDLPLTVCVTRAVSQKLGLFVEDLAPGIPLSRAYLASGTALLVVGTGELEDRLEPLNDEPRALFLQCFDPAFATRLYAAGELFLMPSDFEPCGISQLMALRYGCLPLVHDRGGLHDTVHHGQTGFTFQGADRPAAKQAFLKAAAEAAGAVAGPGYEALVRRAMAQRFPWDQAAAEYEAVYRTVGGKKSRGG